MNDEVIGPIISVYRRGVDTVQSAGFTPKPGLPVARGALILGKDGYSGLFSAWPGSLVDEEFGIYIPGAEGGKGQWFDPDEVAVVQGDESGRTFGVVSFVVKDPIWPAGRASDVKAGEVKNQSNASNWDVVKASLANNLETLHKLEHILPHEQLIPETAAKPKAEFLTVASISPGDFVCRYLLHLD
jgi:hypothetical protein